jgi:hypothetical protein
MTLICLHHLQKLEYAAWHELPRIPQETIRQFKEETIISFRHPESPNTPYKTRKNVDACHRFTDLPNTDLVFIGLEDDSQLAPLIFWDAAHALEIGRRITIIGETNPVYLERTYYKKSFVVEKKHGQTAILRKTSPLPVEMDAGLDRWSFGMPVGPDDATLLNVAVKRILALGIPEKEIILCGRPAANFKYWDHVRIVGEDITAPPIQICKKKNRIAESARYENLCILHDRVFLPLNFLQAIKQFGDLYPFIGFQSIYFDDLVNAAPRRYSDYGFISNSIAELPSTIVTHTPLTLTRFSPAIFPLFDHLRFTCSSVRRYHTDETYLTGSLYICKRSTWNAYPQNERLNWAEYEDIEYGLRTRANGIPSRVNPFALTQSLSGRPILSFMGKMNCESTSGTIRLQSGNSLAEKLPLPRKPLLRVSAQNARKRYADFLRRYAPNFAPKVLRTEAMQLWLEDVALAIYSASFTCVEAEATSFTNDFEKLLLHDEITFHQKQEIIRAFCESGGEKKHALMAGVWFLNMAAQRHSGKIFYSNLIEYLPNRSLLSFLGTWVSALALWLKKDAYIYTPGGPARYFSLLWQSTPFRDAQEDGT